MSGPGDKGKFSAEISQAVIERALESVKKRTDGVEVPLEPAQDAAPAPAPADEGQQPAAEPAELVSARQEIDALKAQLELSLAKGRELMEKIKDTHERMLRASADLENFRKRAQKEKEEVQKFGVEKLLKDMLPIVDNLERALDAPSSDPASLRQGVAMTRKLFEDTLGKHGIKAFSAVGQPFDPRLHEAMQQVETAALPPNHVVHEVLKGYVLNERLVRPALVAVSKPPVATPADPEPPQKQYSQPPAEAPGAAPGDASDSGQTQGS